MLAAGRRPAFASSSRLVKYWYLLLQLLQASLVESDVRYLPRRPPLSLRPHRAYLARFAKLHGKVSGTCVGNLGSMNSLVARHVECGTLRRWLTFLDFGRLKSCASTTSGQKLREAQIQLNGATPPFAGFRSFAPNGPVTVSRCLTVLGLGAQQLRQPGKLAGVCIELCRLRPEGHAPTVSC